MRRATILLADDHVLFAEALVSLLKEAFDVLEVVSDGATLVERALRLRPDVIVSDVSMPTMSGLEALRRLAAETPRPRVVLLTMHADPHLAAEALRLGAAGFVLKQSTGEELISAIQDVLRGRVYLSPRVTREVLTLMTTAAENPESPLTPRQRDVLRLVADGRRMKDVAASLGISIRTAEAVKYDLMRSLNIHSTAQLIRYAIDHHLVEP